MSEGQGHYSQPVRLPEVPESRSSVKLTRNAKGEAQFEVKVYAGDTEADVEKARSLALAQYRDLEAEFGQTAAQHTAGMRDNA